MNSTYLNAKCKGILRKLLNNNSYLSLQQLAEELNISQRSIYYDVCRINEWLSENDIPELRVVRGKGLLLSEQIRIQIAECMEEKNTEEAYVYSPMERVQIIICSIIYSKEPVHVDVLADYCKVSRNSVFNLRVVVKQLQNYDLELEYRSKKGYIIVGNEVKVRAVFLLNYQELKKTFTRDGMKFIDWEKVDAYEETLKKVEQDLGGEYVSDNRESLVVLLPIMEQGKQRIYFDDLKIEEIKQRKEYYLIEKYFSQLNENEKIYLCIHLLGGRIATVSEDIFENTNNEMVYEITKALVTEFEKTACVIFDNKEDLERELFVHINSSLYRYQYGIQSLDMLNRDIIREYPDLFEITKIVSKYLENQIGLPIPDTEVAYLALHFGAHLPISNNKSDKIRVLIVCANGISTGNMLKREIMKMFPEAEVVGVEASSKIKNVQAVCELIVTTVAFKSVVPVVQVHPILTGRDKEVLARHLKKEEFMGKIKVDDLMKIIEPYIKGKVYDEIRKSIEEYLFNCKKGMETEIRENYQDLKSVVDDLRVDIHDGKYMWTQALWETADYLIQNKSIESAYINSIISQIRYYGSYMFIMPRVILAHSKPEMGVNQLDCSIHFFREPVRFSDKDLANVVIVLAAIDQESHLKLLRDIITIFGEDSVVDEFLTCSTKTEILDKFQEVLRAAKKIQIE